ncbi:hypothetical protein QMK19_09110 [Streptomyces sp. H10-C2]|uniref:hypothetical protein n=1 Tax=unclassified Streptomyces TaxID=2593676 RepID=UPI0024B9D142|nr:MULTISPECIES: hypothetical protein [unclassified Streptomyces]MDJ0340935.1 hypothetical protein [Streptomyces sp. PH10-H1]MDJ0369833.1 hypothetical protein [Streptomyces sp. H10-C2]
MSPGELVRALLRRWYVLVLAMVLTAAGAYQVLRPTQLYMSSAVVVLKPPVTGRQPNQFTNLQPPLAAVSSAVIQQLQSPAGVAELSAAGVRGKYQLVPRNSGTSATPRYLIPSLQVQAEQEDPAGADAAVRQIIAVYSKHVQDMQTAQGIASASLMSVDVLVPPSAAGQYGIKSRGLTGVALLGVAGGVLSALWADQYMMGRRGTGTGWLRRAAGRIREVPLSS